MDGPPLTSATQPHVCHCSLPYTCARISWVSHKCEVDDFPVLVKPLMNKGLFAGKLLSPNWFIPIWNRPCDKGYGWFGLALDWPNPRSKT